jgi:hypothetical protein
MKSTIDVQRVLMSEHSRTFTDVQAGMILHKPELFSVYWDIFTSLGEPISSRAAWVVTHAVIRRPGLVGEECIEELLEIAPLAESDGVKRTISKILSLVPLPEKLYGHIVTLCFNWLNDTRESIAVRVYSMEVLQRLAREIPELRGELTATIENHLERFSPGLRNRGMKVIREFGTERG